MKLPRGKWDFAGIYKWSAVLHMPIGTLSLWEFLQAAQGYNEANGGKPKGGTLSEDRLAAMGIAGF